MSGPHSDERPHTGPRPSLPRLFGVFLRLGAYSFGGGYAMIPLMEREVVDRQGWVDRDRIGDMFSLAGSLPGAIALNASAFVGYETRGIPGAITALLGNLTPSVGITVSLLLLFDRFRDVPLVMKAFSGLRPAVIALIAFAAWRLGTRAMTDRVTPILGILAFLLALLLPGLPLPLLILGGALAGIPLHRLVLRRRARRETAARQAPTPEPAPEPALEPAPQTSSAPAPNPVPATPADEDDEILVWDETVRPDTLPEPGIPGDSPADGKGEPT